MRGFAANAGILGEEWTGGKGSGEPTAAAAQGPGSKVRCFVS